MPGNELLSTVLVGAALVLAGVIAVIRSRSASTSDEEESGPSEDGLEGDDGAEALGNARSAGPSDDVRGRLAGLDPRYEAGREVSRSATSVVFLAHDRAEDRTVAIKVVRPGHAADATLTARQEREARILAWLDHPCIVRLHDTQQLDDGRLALVLEHVRGRTLRQTIDQTGPVAPALVIRVLRDMARALDCAEHYNVVHRDIRPDNIFIDSESGDARLADFGNASIGSTDSSDLYSLGVTAYEMLTGNPLDVDASDPAERDSLRSLRASRPDLPPTLVAIVDDLVGQDRAERIANAGDLLHRLEQADAAPVAVSAPIPSAPSADPVRAAAPLDEIELLAARRRAARAAGGRKRRRKSGRGYVVPALVMLALGACGATVVVVLERDKATVFARDAGFPSREALAAAAAARAAADMARADSAAASVDTDSTDAEADGESRTPGIGTLANGPSASPPARMAAATGDDQEAVVGDVLPEPIVVRVTDAAGEPLSDVRVEFRVVAGNGQVAPSWTLTDGMGRASAAWALGTTSGRNTLAAVVTDRPSLVAQFDATGIAGAPASIVVVGDALWARGTARPVTFRVEDRHANPIAGARIDVRVTAGGGTVNRASITTASTGLAETTWATGPDTTDRLTATVAGTPIRLEYAPPRFRVAMQPGIIAGGAHTCILANGDARCWGSNDQGQLGNGTGSGRQVLRPSGRPPFARIAAGISHTCALDALGAAVCWGANASAQLGTGDRAARPAPAAVRTTARLTDLVAGFAHSCALTENRTAVCWGAGDDGQIGDGSTSDRAVPASVTGNRTYIALTAGWRHTCALSSDGVAWCWGANNFGQLGDGTNTNRSVPTRVAGSLRFTGISAGASHTCAVTAAGSAYCWGEGTWGTTPTEVVAPVPFASIVAGAVHTCALARSGEAYCWGRNNSGQLGNESTTGSSEPVLVAGGLRFASLSTSGSHTCGRSTPLGQDFCWGYNVEGQLGDGTRVDRLRPVRSSAR